MTEHASRLALPTNPAWPRGLPLRLADVGLRRGDAEILRGITLQFDPDRRYVLVGPSGAGKSTLLRLLNRLDDPTSGLVLVGDAPLPSFPVSTLRRGIGLLFQASRPLDGTLADNLAYPFEVRGLPRPPARLMAAALDEVGLDPTWLDRDAAALSGGERQRLALAVALGVDPEILALDEPTSALDPASAHRVAECLDRRVAESGLRTIAVSHHREHAPRLGDTAVVMEAGRIVDQGPTREVLQKADVAFWRPSGAEEVAP